MDFFTSLLKAYEKAEEIGLVDQQDGHNPCFTSALSY